MTDSIFSELNSIADNDVKFILGTKKITPDVTIGHDAKVKDLADHLDEIEDRNSATIEILDSTSIAQESNNLSEKDLKILSACIKAISGRGLKQTALESGDVKTASTFALEGIKDTLKQFWKYIKEAIKKFWNLLKSWWIRAFDISKRAKARAEKLRLRADQEYGSPIENEMDFSEVKKLAIDGKFTDISLILRGFKVMEDMMGEFIEVRTSEPFNDVIDELSDQVNTTAERIRNTGINILKANESDENFRLNRNLLTLNKSDIDALIKISDKVFVSNDSDLVSNADFSFTNADKYRKQYADEDDAVMHSELLPGDKWIISVKPKLLAIGTMVQATDVIEYIRRSKFVLAPCRYGAKSYDQVIKAKVLQPTSISRGCDSVEKICEYVYEYKTAFEKRERFKDRVIKEIDRTVDDIIDESDSALAEVDRLIRSYANSVTGLIRRRSDFETSLCAYAVSISVAFLNYGEASLKRYTR